MHFKEFLYSIWFFFVFICIFLGKLFSDKIHHFHSTIYMSKPCQIFPPHYWCHIQVSLRLTTISLKTQLIKTSTYSSRSHMSCITVNHCYIFGIIKQTEITALRGSNSCIININMLGARDHKPIWLTWYTWISYCYEHASITPRKTPYFHRSTAKCKNREEW